MFLKPGREIRAGRRHLGAQRGPSFSILTSANEKLSRFLQDPAQLELRLHPMQKSERDQLSRLASLYSLQMLSEGARGLKCPLLKKTRYLSIYLYKVVGVSHPLFHH